MNRIHLETIPSTNEEMKRLMGLQTLSDFTCITASHQTAAKGQRGNKWVSEPGKNIALSVYKTFDRLKIGDQFAISMATALALKEVFSDILSGVSVKWPNDILVNDRKIAGVLIETGVLGSSIPWAVIGVGVNVQQHSFSDLPFATSFAKEGVPSLTTEALVLKMLPVIEKHLHTVEQCTYTYLKAQYESVLYGHNSIKKFKQVGGEPFFASVDGVNENGSLCLKTLHGERISFHFKEIEMLR
ncbi:biotin--[acetyl-CoA-carboxylase] ligase [Flavobacteriaceae bacterium LSUCC0859]|jgi:BirA family biotin operon repressor/biotin-[acetyl-CoA-carboxylase] ligase|nr:biotin--[acetyl-CoA-carboxylase] ligase [Flavobacteriaceae bacterium LSUCC0859]